jgi:branched-subunit amino acid transport protein
MNAAWTALAGLAIGVYACKAAGPILLGDRELPRWLGTLAARVPGPLLAALTVVSGIGDGARWAPDARLIGLLCAGLALWRRANFAVVVLIAAVATAATRAIA